MRLAFVVVFCILFPLAAPAVPFTDLQPFTGNYYNTLAWGDCDLDGLPDLAIVTTRAGQTYTGVFRNQGDGTFADMGVTLPYLASGNIAWVDIDGDGDLDLQLSGYLENPYNQTRLFRNDGNFQFTEVMTSLPGISYSAAAWADFDGDGDPDIVLQGASAEGLITRVYQNQGAGVFTDLNANLQGMNNGAVRWGDFEGDGDLDIISIGMGVNTGIAYTKIYLNNGVGNFTEHTHNLPQVYLGDVQWADFDGDGDLDVLLCGTTSVIDGNSPVSGVFRNDAGTFAEIPLGMTGLIYSKALWCDLDCDGDPDFILSGCDPVDRLLYCFSNNGDGSFSEVLTSLPAVVNGSIIASDFDNDGDPDLCVGGSLGRQAAVVLRNNLNFSFQSDLPILQRSTANGSAWADWDNDGDLDFAVSTYPATTLYRNEGQGVFTEAASFLPYINYGSLDWGDYDRDGDLDLLLSGISDLADYLRSSFVLRNDGAGVFTDIAAGLFGLDYCDASWADYDNDGDLDILLCGQNYGAIYYTLLYRNDGGDEFTEVTHNITPFRGGDAAWGDYNGDGFPDLAIGGETQGLVSRVEIYRNNGNGSFTLANFPPNQLFPGRFAWEDHDGDGDLDLASVGSYNGAPFTVIFRNEGNDDFTLVSDGLVPLKDGMLAWGDLDGDGEPDLLTSGVNAQSNSVLEICLNSGSGSFLPQSHLLRGPKRGIIDPGDFDGDGDLDVLIGGLFAGTAYTSILRNETTFPNTPPTPPTALGCGVTNGRLIFAWEPGSDAETAPARLSYALRLGITPGGIEISAPHALPDGTRLLHRRGTLGSGRTWSIALADLPPAEFYYWSVQTIDSCHQGSPFATEQVFSFTCAGDPTVPAPTALAFSSLHPNPFSASLEVRYALPCAASFALEVFNLRGQKVRALASGEARAGTHAAAWDGRDDSGRVLPNGIYLLRLSSEGKRVLGRAVLLR